MDTFVLTGVDLNNDKILLTDLNSTQIKTEVSNNNNDLVMPMIDSRLVKGNNRNTKKIHIKNSSSVTSLP